MATRQRRTRSKTQEAAEVKADVTPVEVTEENEPKLVTPSDIAKELSIRPVQFRIFLRAKDMGVGRGKRYGFTPEHAAKLKAEYEAKHAAAEDDEAAETEANAS